MDRPISIAMAALGGQGGGVLTGWLVETAEANGYLAQSTYVAGVAQRTGATVYCVEMFPKAVAEAKGKLPVFTPYPVPGDVDLVIAGEMAETARAIEKGFVTPNCTTLIGSSHRVYSMPEKEALGDGRMDMTPVAELASRASKQFINFDMQAAADETGSVISSVMLGAIAASGALPFDREAFEDTIRRMGKAVDANLRGFAAGFERATAPGESGSTVSADEVPVPAGKNGEALAHRIEAELPEPVRGIALHGALRALDYQDVNYAHEYLDLLAAFSRVDNESNGYELTSEVARQLALQLCYEDTMRVADLKTRPERFERIREQVGAAEGQPVRVVEYLHPRIEEFCDTLPAFLGSAIIRSPAAQKLVSPLFRKGRNITTSSMSGFLLLTIVAKMGRFRRISYRYRKQRAFIDTWLDRVTAAGVDDYDYGLAVARSVEIVRGYGETYDRGLSRYLRIVKAGDAATVRRLHEAALADERGERFEAALESIGAVG
jgi:indolepyruvate ferredoxin oxidoreductase beta subunit